ncbi:MAG: hypothetical protein ABIU58_11025 [Ramlibacter sp.]
MTISLTQSCIRHLALGLAAIALAGCATTASTPELAVRERATNHWKARLADDMEAAYTFMPPSYRAITPLPRYKQAFGGAVKLTAAQVERIRCETEDKCVATTKIEAKATLQRASVPPIVTFYDEVWVRENGQWWLFPTP